MPCLASPAPEPTGNSPLTIAIDPANPAVVSFQLHSLKLACRFYNNAADFIGFSAPSSCLVKIVCDIGTPNKRVEAAGTYEYNPDNADVGKVSWAVAGRKPWTFDVGFAEITKCVFTADDEVGDHGQTMAILIDDLAVTVTTC